MQHRTERNYGVERFVLKLQCLGVHYPIIDFGGCAFCCRNHSRGKINAKHITRWTDALNRHFAPGLAPVAHALSSALVAVDLPDQWAGRPVEFVAEMENLTVEADHRERIVINEKTGTIVLGKDVRISPVAILHGALSVEVRTTLEVTQPAPLSGGQTSVTPQTAVAATEEAVLNSMLAAPTVTGRDGNTSPGLPAARVRELLAEAGRIPADRSVRDDKS